MSGCAFDNQTTTTEPPTEQTKTESTKQDETATATLEITELKVVHPVEDYNERRYFKNFGEYFQNRFTGYHVAEDVEFTDALDEEIPIVAIADGTVDRINQVGGYGGLITVQHNINNRTVTALYGHIDLESSDLNAGDQVEMGQFLANLGDHESTETDGERKHLHFGLYEGTDDRVSGYVDSQNKVSNWINPQNFYLEHNVATTTPERQFNPANSYDVGSDIFNLTFNIPPNWEVEYIPSLEALNLYILDGDGTARDRSQILIRYFDATTFLTLNTVTIFSTEDMTAGSEDYVARRYDIEKNAGIPDFRDQPSWRNERHIVTDFRKSEGFTRYFVVAANPELDPTVYEKFLDGITIVE